jgi:hypothetical protein
LTNAFVGFKHKTFEDYYNETYGGNKWANTKIN